MMVTGKPKFTRKKPFALWAALSCLLSLLGVQEVRSEVAAVLANTHLRQLAKDVVGKLGIYYGINLQQHLRSTSTSPFNKPAAASKATIRQGEFEEIENQVEEWANAMLAESGGDGSFLAPGTNWKEIDCHRALKRIYNPSGETRQFVKWMPDSRGQHADHTDTKLHPCMKVYSTIDAPFDLVCRYLSQEQRYKEYNSLLIDQKDVEELTPHSKICWSQTKKLLFIQPRDFITYCSHKWRGSHQQVILNQACDYPSYPMTGLRAFGLRGATILSKHPDDPNRKTSIILLSHCNCGNDIPEWAVRTAVGVLAPVKPFEIIHRINVGVAKAKDELKRMEDRASDSGSSSRPGGMAQMGYACFWPNGGGEVL